MICHSEQVSLGHTLAGTGAALQGLQWCRMLHSKCPLQEKQRNRQPDSDDWKLRPVEKCLQSSISAGKGIVIMS